MKTFKFNGKSRNYPETVIYGAIMNKNSKLTLLINTDFENLNNLSDLTFWEINSDMPNVAQYGHAFLNEVTLKGFFLAEDGTDFIGRNNIKYYKFTESEIIDILSKITKKEF